MLMSRLPPGPSLALVQTLRYLRDPYGIYSAYLEKYGDPFTLAGAGGPMVVTGTPEGVRTILSAPPEGYAAFGADLLAPVLGEYSMMLLSGEAHRASRRLLAPPFHSARMRLYGRVMQECTRQQIEPWLARQPFPLFPVTQAISLAVMVRAVFGVTEPERVQAYERALIDVLEAVNPSFLFIAALRRNFGGVGPWARFVRRRERIEALLLDEFASRRREQQPREDILSLLLSARYEDGSPMSDTDIIGQLMTLLAAGHETTAISLSWALYLLHGHEQVLERLRDELRTLPDDADPDAVARLPLLEAVCHETLRLHPITPIIARALVAPLELMGYQLPAGVSVGASILLVHRRADLYPEPEQFQPDRFLTRSYSPFEFLPFGGGVRRCIGAAFALYEMKLVLATLLRSYRFSLETTADPGHAVRNTTVGPRRAILMRAEPL
jgi:cytochrome P450